MKPSKDTENTASSFHTPEQQDTPSDVIIAHALKEARAYVKQEKSMPHPYDVPEQLINGMANPLVALFADSGRVPKDYRSRLRRRELAEATEPTYTPDELMGCIRSKEPGTGGVQRRIHIQTPTDPEGYPVVFFTTHPGSVVYINGVPARRRSYQNIMCWCGEVVEPTEGDGKWGLNYLTTGGEREGCAGFGSLVVHPHVYFDGKPVSLDKVPDLIRGHGALHLLEPPPLMIGDSLDAVEWLFGRETQDFYRMKALISSGRYLENPYGEDPYDVHSGW